MSAFIALFIDKITELRIPIRGYETDANGDQGNAISVTNPYKGL